MNRTSPLQDALAIWQAGVDAVRPERLIADKLHVDRQHLVAGRVSIDLRDVRRLLVVGGGKASAGLAMAFEKLVVPQLHEQLPDLEVSGWVNCPEGTFDPTAEPRAIRLFAARPSGRNEPTEKAVHGTQEILRSVASCTSHDLVLCLLSGGGSALLTAPAAGITLADKQAVARSVAGAGANIEQLNTIRRALSDVKGGGLARACRAGRMVTLILSDVLGDSLETIASGPTYVQSSVSRDAALSVVHELGLADDPSMRGVVAWLSESQERTTSELSCQVDHVILGNNQDAVKSAQVAAQQLGFQCQATSASASEGDVLQVAAEAAQAIQSMLQPQHKFTCWISGGEPTCQVPNNPGRGGRNQQLTLAVMHQLEKRGLLPIKPREELATAFAFVSGGTDGEDGPTDAAGGFFDDSIATACRSQAATIERHLETADAYPMLLAAGGLLRTGPTSTNVCDLRVAVVSKQARVFGTALDVS